ncbi:unnamed protein product, partial [Rotaria sp. Silwood1]
MEHILLLSDYPNLTYLKIFNFEEENVHYFIGDAIKFTSKLRVYSLNNNSMDSSTEYGIPESNKYRQHLTKGEYSPIDSIHKINGV